MKTNIRDEMNWSAREVIVNGAKVESASKEEFRKVVVELVAGEDGIPERMSYYGSREFTPQWLSASWTRRDDGEWKLGHIEIGGQGFGKDGKTPLKGRTRRSDGTLAMRWPLAVTDRTPPAWTEDPVIKPLWAPHDPNVSWPQEVTADPQ